MASVPQQLASPRWIARLFVAAAVVLVPWTLMLGYRLPARHTSDHWDLAWIGFDVAIALALAVTGLGIARCAPWVQGAAAVAATLLLSDAWFDNVLSRSHEEHIEAGLEALLVELPLALLCLWLARNAEHAVAAVRDARERLDPRR